MTAEEGKSGLTQEEIQALLDGRKIQAIKLYRERTGAGLKEAKDAVEAYDAKSGFDRPRPLKPGCMALLALIQTFAIALVLAIVAWLYPL